MRPSARPLSIAFAALLAACSAQSTPPTAPPATPAPATIAMPSAATQGPIASPSPAPVSTPGPTPSPTATAPDSPGATSSPSASPTGSPTATASPSGQPTAPLAVSLDGRLRDILNQQRNQRRIPGLSATIVFPDGSTWDGSSGQSQLNPAQRATTMTPFVVGSITKTFVTAALMELVEDGALSLDDPLSNWLPDYPRAADITLRHLASHTAGVFNYFEHRTYNTKVFKTMRGHHWAPEEILATFDAPPYFAPGGGYHYSNTGFVLLGMVIEMETGQSMESVLRERFLTPLGLTSTYFQDDAGAPSNAAHGYLLKSTGYKQISDGTSFRPTVSAATVAWAAGSIAASARDIARWGDALYGGHLLEPDSLAQMIDYTYYPNARETYGLGTRTRLYNGVRMFGHTGSLRGFVASMWHYPDEDLTVVVLTNRGRIDSNPIADALSAAALPAAQSYNTR